MNSSLVVLVALFGVTLSQDVAFFAKKSYTNRPGKIEFATTETDVGYGWDPRNSVFRTYHPGLYYFSFSALSNENDYCRLALMKNGYDEVVAAYGHQNGYQQVTGSAILDLQRNDEVLLELKEGSLYESNTRGRAYTTLLGYRLGTSGNSGNIGTGPKIRPGEPGPFNTGN